MKMQLAGIRRNTKYSPNMITNDSLIILKTAEELVKLGANYKIYDESELLNEKINERVIFSMARGSDSLNILSQMEENGKLIINSPKASLNCYRADLISKLNKAGIPFPKSRLVSTSSGENFKLHEFESKKVWIKRGDVHAVHREDVSPAYGDEELNFILKEFAHRGIKEAILQEHIDGDVIKFYAVKGSNFFRWYYVNGNHYKFDVDLLNKLSDKSAEALNLIIYGGDAIVSTNGRITIIDINDWPSFASFRDEAGKHIAEKIFSLASEYEKLNN